MPYDCWLLFNTGICHWIVQMYWLYKYKGETKQKEYRVEFDYQHRYRIEMNYYPRSGNFITEFYKNNKFFAKIIFKNPIHWCETLVEIPSKETQLFVKLNLNNVGFTVT